MAPKEHLEEVLDVLIIGAGPAGLATAARLRERLPDALFTDEEHRRYRWMGKHGNKVALKHVQTGKKTAAKSHSSAQQKSSEYNIAVLDAEADTWLGRWERLFTAFDIEHLRSPMLWHVDPLDRDALLAHAFCHGREDEMIEIKNCVGKEMSKHAHKKGQRGPKALGGRQSGKVILNLRERNDYYTPSQALFLSHCQDVANRYRLGPGLVHKEAVEDITYGTVRGLFPHDDDEKVFTVTTDKSIRYAKAVVLAVGPGNAPTIPRTPSMPADGPIPQACHSMHIKTFPDPLVQQRIDAGLKTNVLVLGGGLTSAQLADLAIRRGVTRVWHLMRGSLKLKHFDVDLDWMGKYRNLEQARFWNAETDEDRLQMIKEARGGGSVTPLFYYKRTKKHVASGKVVLSTNTKLVDAILEECHDEKHGNHDVGPTIKRWTVQTEPPVKDMPKMDFIYFATGIQTDVEKISYLRNMFRDHPIKTAGGFPCVTEDLKWRDDVPMFVTGRLAALQLGPAAPNIGGAKIGAERVAWGIDELVRPSGIEKDERHESYSSGHGNMYSLLSGGE